MIPPGLDGLRDRSVLVTGAGGFLGAAVVARLVGLGARVRAWLGPAPSADLRPPPPGVAVSHGDVADAELLARQLAEVDVVYHLAGPASAAASFAAPASYLRVHAVGTAAVLEGCVAAGVAHLVQVSSAEVYAVASEPVPEDHPRLPRSPYGIAKLAAELTLEACAAVDGLTTTIVRPFSVFGPGAPPASLIASVAAAIARGEAPAIADPRPVRDYCHLDDVADGIVRAGVRPGRGLRHYNLASGRGVAVIDVVRAALRAAGRSDTEIRRRAADRPTAAVTLSLIGAPTRAAAELGFHAAIGLEDGLARLVRGPGEARS